MITTGIRDLKNNLSGYIRRVEAGERVTVTHHGRVVAEIVPPERGARRRPGSRYEELVAAGMIRLAQQRGDPLADLPDLALTPGTASLLIDADREDG